ncbi:MAG TPA: hypothetical protein VNO54_17805, partial [Streptosporangiaceae bacterium]|nr:hypothetical protein [Streptosporangiaceae bacterium]
RDACWLWGDRRAKQGDLHAASVIARSWLIGSDRVCPGQCRSSARSASRSRSGGADRRLSAGHPAAWEDEEDYRGGRIPIWVGGNSDVGLRRAVRLREAWHPLRFTMSWLREAVGRMTALAGEQRRPVPGLASASRCG